MFVWVCPVFGRKLRAVSSVVSIFQTSGTSGLMCIHSVNIVPHFKKDLLLIARITVISTWTILKCRHLWFIVMKKNRACEKTKVFSCVLLLIDTTVVIFYKKVYTPPFPIRMLLWNPMRQLRLFSVYCDIYKDCVQ